MTNGRRWGWVLVAPGLLLAACGSKVAVPEGAQLSCASSSDCPSGRICYRDRCVNAGSIDTTPPDLAAAPVVSPAVGRAGATFTIDLAPSEPLSEAPQVTLALVPPVTAPCAASGGGYRCSYTATGNENGGLGGVVPFDVRLVDRGFNETRRNLAGALSLDFTPPTAAAASVEPASARLGAVIQVFLTASEALAGDPVVVASRPLDAGAGTESRFPMSREPGTLNWTFAHLVTAGDAQGAVSFSVEMVDVAGNAAPSVPLGAAVIDGVAPVISGLAAGPARVNGTGTVTASFEVDETVPAPEVTIGGRPMSCGARQPTPPSYTCTRPMVGDELPAGEEAPQSVVVEVADAAGNRATAGVSVVFDFRPPALTLATVAYVPAPDNPLATVTAAKEGTRIQVVLAADEALRPVPALAASRAGWVLPFAQVPGTFTGTGITLEATVPPGALDGDYAATITMVDLAGNRADLRLAAPRVRVKTSPPTLTVNQDAIVFVRSPWGNGAPEDLGGHTIPAGPYFGIEPSDPLSAAARLPAGTFLLDGGTTPAMVVVQLGADPSSLRLGALLPDAGGTWPRQPLASPDTPTAFVVGVDGAGNRSTPEKVRDAEWVATSNAGPLGSAPHRLGRLPAACPLLEGCTDAAVVPGAEAASPDGQAILARAWATWEERTVPATVPVARSTPGMAYDAGRNRMVIFGGYTTFGNLQETWELGPSGWTDAAPAIQPPARWGHASVYDAGRRRVVMFGGSGTQDWRDTWEWDGATWRDVTPQGATPGPRRLHAMAYDSARGRTVLFGGAGGTEISQETWEWDGTSWTSIAPAGASPGARYGHSMVYDSARGRVVLFGGGSATAYLNDTWEWDGRSWTNVTPAGTSPAIRARHAAAFDVRRGRTVVFGGIDAAGVRQDLWEWTGTAWVNVVAGGAPAGREDHGMAYDTVRGRVVLFGGYTTSLVGDTWEWDGAAWANVTSTGANPAARSRCALAFDPLRQRTVLFGGISGGVALSDTWVWDGRRWVDVTPAGARPGGRFSHAMTYQPGRGRTLLFGGADTAARYADTWEWDGSTWTSVTPAASPPARMDHSLAADPVSGTILFAGSGSSTTLGDTWRWSGSAWSNLAPASSPGARSGHSMVLDSLRGRVVLFGGQPPSAPYAGDTWEWNGSAWANVTPAGTSPNPRYEHAMAFDVDRGRTVMFGGYARSPTQGVLGFVQDAWEWNGAAWADLGTGGAIPPARSYPAMVYDSARRRMVLFGGGGNAILGDTWELDASPSTRPAIQFDATGLTAAGSGLSPTAVRVRAFVGGTFAPGGPSSVGATLLGWTSHSALSGPGAWVELAANAAGVAAQQPYLGPPGATLIDWSTVSPAVARGLVTGREGRLSFQLRPSGTMGPNLAGARVALDYIEVRVRYRNP